MLHVIHELLKITHDLIFEVLQVFQLSVNCVEAARADSWAALTLFEIGLTQSALFLRLQLRFPIWGCDFPC